jgi:hypothetical protein
MKTFERLAHRASLGSGPPPLLVHGWPQTWMLDHDARSYSLIARVFNGQEEGLTRDDILDNVPLYRLTNTGVSSARLNWESTLALFAPKGIAIPATRSRPASLPHANQRSVGPRGIRSI